MQLLCCTHEVGRPQQRGVQHVHAVAPERLRWWEAHTEREVDLVRREHELVDAPLAACLEARPPARERVGVDREGGRRPKRRRVIRPQPRVCHPLLAEHDVEKMIRQRQQTLGEKFALGDIVDDLGVGRHAQHLREDHDVVRILEDEAARAPAQPCDGGHS